MKYLKYLKLYESFDTNEIHEICKKYSIRNYTINNDGSIDVDGDVNLYKRKLIKLPLKFNKVNFFNCSENKLLTSLEGSPIEVNKGFFCCSNNLKSFQYAPKIIRGDFRCNYNNIKSFEYFPIYVVSFSCFNNPIYQVWKLFKDDTKIELLNDFDIFRDEDERIASIVMDRLNDFLLTIGKKTVEKVDRYKNI